jgi:2-(1,2-epoxy-1,2-dihydrophenyl)acetyl-CoA isomerase
MSRGAEDEELVTRRVENGAAYLKLNRPEAFNALSLGMARRFLALLQELADDEAVRAVVVGGEGKIFSGGGDVKQMLGDVKERGDRDAYFREPLTAFHQVVLALRELPKPVVAAVHGAVAGASFNLVLACDIRIAAEGTRFNQAFVSVGVSPDCGGTYFLPRLVGHTRACELTMLPTQLDASQALEWGLINKVVPADRFEEEVRRTAEALAAGPTQALGRTKSLLNRAYDRPLAEQLEFERLAQVENAKTHDFEEGLTAFVEKRKPDFQGK